MAPKKNKQALKLGADDGDFVNDNEDKNKKSGTENEEENTLAGAHLDGPSRQLFQVAYNEKSMKPQAARDFPLVEFVRQATASTVYKSEYVDENGEIVPQRPLTKEEKDELMSHPSWLREHATLIFGGVRVLDMKQEQNDADVEANYSLMKANWEYDKKNILDEANQINNNPDGYTKAQRHMMQQGNINAEGVVEEEKLFQNDLDGKQVDWATSRHKAERTAITMPEQVQHNRKRDVLEELEIEQGHDNMLVLQDLPVFDYPEEDPDSPGKRDSTGMDMDMDFGNDAPMPDLNLDVEMGNASVVGGVNNVAGTPAAGAGFGDDLPTPVGAPQDLAAQNLFGQTPMLDPVTGLPILGKPPETPGGGLQDGAGTPNSVNQFLQSNQTNNPTPFQQQQVNNTPFLLDPNTLLDRAQQVVLQPGGAAPIGLGGLGLAGDGGQQQAIPGIEPGNQPSASSSAIPGQQPQDPQTLLKSKKQKPLVSEQQKILTFFKQLQPDGPDREKLTLTDEEMRKNISRRKKFTLPLFSNDPEKVHMKAILKEFHHLPFPKGGRPHMAMTFNHQMAEFHVYAHWRGRHQQPLLSNSNFNPMGKQDDIFGSPRKRRNSQVQFEDESDEEKNQEAWKRQRRLSEEQEQRFGNSPIFGGSAFGNTPSPFKGMDEDLKLINLQKPKTMMEVVEIAGTTGDNQDQEEENITGYSARTAKMHQFISGKYEENKEKHGHDHLDDLKNEEDGEKTVEPTFSYLDVCEQQEPTFLHVMDKKKALAGCFFEMLVLKTMSVIDVAQDEKFGDIVVTKGLKWTDEPETDDVGLRKPKKPKMKSKADMSPVQRAFAAKTSSSAAASKLFAKK